MKITKVLVCAVIAAVLSGCVGTNLVVDQPYSYQPTDAFSYEIVDKANVTDKGMSIFKSKLDQNLSQLGLQQGDNQGAAGSNRVIEITFNNYYMRHGAARALAGVMAGADNITSTVLIKDKESREVLSRLQVESKNPTATSSARALIEQHATKITDYIKTGKI